MCVTLGPYTRVGRVADRENCAWASAIFKHSGSVQKATPTISEGSTILAELHLIDQRCQTGLKSMLCGKAGATPFCQHLSCDFRSRVLSRFFPAGVEAKLYTLSKLKESHCCLFCPPRACHGAKKAVVVSK